MFPFQEFYQFANNPLQYLTNSLNKRGFQVPQNQMTNPQQLIQYMMNNGILSQQQYNQAVNQANQLQKQPAFMQSIYSMFSNH